MPAYTLLSGTIIGRPVSSNCNLHRIHSVHGPRLALMCRKISMCRSLRILWHYGLSSRLENCPRIKAINLISFDFDPGTATIVDAPASQDCAQSNV